MLPLFAHVSRHCSVTGWVGAGGRRKQGYNISALSRLVFTKDKEGLRFFFMFSVIEFYLIKYVFNQKNYVNDFIRNVCTIAHYF